MSLRETLWVIQHTQSYMSAIDPSQLPNLLHHVLQASWWGGAGAPATYLLYHRPPQRLLSHECSWGWGYGSAPALPCPTTVAESISIRATRVTRTPLGKQPWVDKDTTKPKWKTKTKRRDTMAVIRVHACTSKTNENRNASAVLYASK